MKRDKEFDLIISITIFYVSANLFTLTIAYLLYRSFSLSNDDFVQITLFLLFISSIIGFFIAKFTLKPYFDRARFLDKLIKNTLHELNIPVATIFANVELLKRKNDDEKSLKRLDRIKTSSEKLQRLYKELDYFIKFEIEALDKESFNLKELILEEIEQFRELKGDIQIDTNLSNRIVFANKSGFIKTLNNLISNAIKYNKKDGFINIELNHRYLIVEDSGIGLSDSEIFKIFDRYYQGDSTSSGYGIGLNIVKSFCDEHKIAIKIESTKGFGSRFIIDLINL